MKSDEILAKLKAYADQEELEGQWGSYAGNNRCKTYGRLIKELDRLLRAEVSPVIEMDVAEAKLLGHAIMFSPDLEKLHVVITGEQVKFKINNYDWFPLLGRKA